MDVTKNFRGFADMVDVNYHEVYDFNQAASGNEDSQATFRVVPANGAPDDTLIIYNAHHDVTVLRLSPAAKAQGFIYTRIGER